jgi:hypothetical protein
MFADDIARNGTKDRNLPVEAQRADLVRKAARIENMGTPQMIFGGNRFIEPDFLRWANMHVGDDFIADINGERRCHEISLLNYGNDKVLAVFARNVKN